MSEGEPASVQGPASPPAVEPRPDAAARVDEAAGSVEAQFSAFYRDFVTPLINFLVWLGAPLHLAADLAQETMVKAYQRWRQIEKPDTWARTVASRELVRYLSRVQEEPVAEADYEANALMAYPDETAQWEAQHELEDLLAALPARQRQVLAWSVAGYSPAEIAAVLGIEPEAARANLYKARRRVAERMAARGEAGS